MEKSNQPYICMMNSQTKETYLILKILEHHAHPYVTTMDQRGTLWSGYPEYDDRYYTSFDTVDDFLSHMPEELSQKEVVERLVARHMFKNGYKGRLMFNSWDFDSVNKIAVTTSGIGVEIKHEVCMLRYDKDRDCLIIHAPKELLDERDDREIVVPYYYSHAILATYKK